VANYTNLYTNPPVTTANNEQRQAEESGLGERLLEQQATTAHI
jgi:hypothetical protein